MITFHIEDVSAEPFRFHPFVIVRRDSETGKGTWVAGARTMEEAKAKYLEHAKAYAVSLFKAARQERRAKAFSRLAKQRVEARRMLRALDAAAERGWQL